MRPFRLVLALFLALSFGLSLPLPADPPERLCPAGVPVVEHPHFGPCAEPNG